MSEENALVVRQYDGLTMAIAPSVAEQRLQELRAFVAKVMEKGQDFGVIPGTDKATLLQPGAQKLAEVYGFAPAFTITTKIEDWEKPLFHYEVKCVLTSRRDGSFVGEGDGSCNSREKRYAGRWAFDNEIPAGIDKKTLKTRTGKSKKNGRSYTQFWIPNDAIFDLVNTIRKMANKRALVAAVIAATRSAGVFTQDVEDIADDEPPPPQDEAPPQEPAKPEVSDDDKKKTHHELRMLLTSAKSAADLDGCKTIIARAWNAGRLTQALMDDLVAYGKECRERFTKPKGEDSNASA